jgi:hypothetical protein
MEIQGKIKMIDTTKEVGTSGFKKRDIVVTTDEQYPQDILIQFVQDKCEILDKFKVGENVTISINIRGRMWTDPTGKEVYFNTLQGWLIKHDATTPAPTTVPVAEFAPAPKQPAGQVEDDGLPF